MPGLDTLLGFSLQFGCLAAPALLLPFVVRLADPRVAYVYWRGALVISLLAPFVGIFWRPESNRVAGSFELVVSALGSNDAAGGPGYVLWTLVAGTIAMLLWRGEGLLRLAGFRRRATRLSAETLFPAPRLEEALGVRPEYYETDELSGPLTFGLLRPSILLPVKLRGPASVKLESVLTHEMIHVRNRDWAQVLAEESVRCLLWFHPLVHMLIERLRCAREMSVDAETVRITGDRERYLAALVEVAERRQQQPWIAAPLFGGSRLNQRIETLLEDYTMSKFRIILVTLLALAVFSIGGRLANKWFPFSAFAAENYEVHEVGDNVTSPKLIRKIEPKYTVEAKEADLQGSVWLSVEVHPDGRAHNVEVLERLGMGLDEQTVAAVEQWAFDPARKDGKPVVVSAKIQVTFKLL